MWHLHMAIVYGGKQYFSHKIGAELVQPIKALAANSMGFNFMKLT